MPKKFVMNWQQDTARWRKMHTGRWFFVTPKELGCHATKEASWKAANDWWIRKLATLTTPALILQGTRDTFGVPDEVAGYGLSTAIRVEWIEEGDHSFKPPRSSGRTEAENVARAVEVAADFLLSHTG